MRRLLAFALLLAACTAAPPSAWRVVESDMRADPVEDGSIGEIRYAGEESVRGTFQMHPDAEFPALCFFVDELDRGKLPRFRNDVRRPWFCFTNEDDVRRVAKAGQTARIRIADYHYRYSHTDTYNSARFVRIEAP